MDLIALSEGVHATYDGSRVVNNRLTLAADTCAFMTRRVWTVDGRVGVYKPSVNYDSTARTTCVRRMHSVQIRTKAKSRRDIGK